MLDQAPQALKASRINLRQNFFSREILADGFQRAHVVKLNDAELTCGSSLPPISPAGSAASCGVTVSS